MKQLKTFVYAVLAGISIGLGGTVFLTQESKVLGSALFTVGLFMVLTRGFNLFTGKVCYIFEKDLRYALDLPIMWLGNLLGAWLTGMAVRSTRYLTAEIVEKATKICQAKLNDNLLSIFILAVLCNMLIYIAVDGFNRNPHDLGKYLSVFFGVMVFIICGFEHCVANMYYFSVADMWSWKTLLYVIVMTLGNSVGGVIFPVLKKWKEKEEKEPVKTN